MNTIHSPTNGKMSTGGANPGSISPNHLYCVSGYLSTQDRSGGSSPAIAKSGVSRLQYSKCWERLSGLAISLRISLEATLTSVVSISHDKEGFAVGSRRSERRMSRVSTFEYTPERRSKG
jgi:hypothetical protein